MYGQLFTIAYSDNNTQLFCFYFFGSSVLLNGRGAATAACIREVEGGGDKARAQL